MAIRFKAHAKLNLGLEVCAQRPDGYHLIDTIFQEITLCDFVEVVKDDMIRIDCPGIPQQRNTAYAATRAFFETAGIRGGSFVRIEKRIPAGSGLGGGSSDAATVLAALNDLYGRPLSRASLMEAALRVGADTPFFLAGGTQRAEGVGERLRPFLNRCPFLYLLVMPEARVDTREAYRLYDQERRTVCDMDRVEQALATGDREAYFQWTANALMPAAERLVPDIADVGRACMDAGAQFWLMTGSGSCVFSVFRSADVRERARAQLAARYPFVVCAENCGVPAGASPEER